MEIKKFGALFRLPLFLITHRCLSERQLFVYTGYSRTVNLGLFYTKGHPASKTKKEHQHRHNSNINNHNNNIRVRAILNMPPSFIQFSKLNDDSTVGSLQNDCSLKSDYAVLERSADCLKNGGVIAVPTDTVYGVACFSQNTEAINRIYAIKNRNYQNPIAISVAAIEDISRWSQVTVSNELLHKLLPGPVTLVFERKLCLNLALNPLTNLVGIRIPKNQFMQDLAKKCGGPIALTSANLSGTKSCLNIEEFENLWCQLDLVVNGGKLNDTEEARLGSTVVDLSVPHSYRIIRPGSAHRSTVECLENFDLQELTQPL